MLACLGAVLPTFYIVGVMTALTPKETIMRYLVRKSSKIISYLPPLQLDSFWHYASAPCFYFLGGFTKKGDWSWSGDHIFVRGSSS